MTSYLVVVNPVSGRGRARVRAGLLAAALSKSSRVDVVETSRRGSAVDLVAARGEGVDRVIAVGGDGTLNEVLAGVLAAGASSDARPALGFLPSGTANAATHAFSFSSDPGAVARGLANAVARPVDVGVVTHAGGERPYLLWFGAGFDAVVIDALNTTRTGRMGILGLVQATPRVLGAVARYAAPAIDVEVDGAPLPETSSVIVANVGELAFGGTVTRTADPFDGRLDVLAVPPTSKLGLIGFGLRMMTSGLDRASGVRRAAGTEIRLTSLARVPFQVDGEPAGTLPAVVRVDLSAVRILLT